MSDTLFIILVLFVAIGGLVGVAYFLDKRGKKSKPIRPPLPEPGPTGRVLLWIARILVVIMVAAQFISQRFTMTSTQQNKAFMYIMPNQQTHRSNIGIPGVDCFIGVAICTGRIPQTFGLRRIPGHHLSNRWIIRFESRHNKECQLH